jgi:cytochrome c556
LLRAPQPELARADAALKRIGQSCVDCHRRYRNE